MFRRRGVQAEGQPRFGDRRRSSRQTAGWEGRYRVVDLSREHLHYAGDDYESCTLTDLSMEGVGLHLVTDDVAIGDCVELDLPLGAHQHASIQVRGEVRHKSSDEAAPPRAGLEFVGIGALERALLLRLLRNLQSPTSQSA